MQQQKHRSWIFPSLLTILAIDAISFGIVLPLLPQLVGAQGEAAIVTQHPEFMRGLMLAIFPLMSMIGTACLGYLSDNIGRKRTLAVSLFGSAAGLGLTGMAILMHSLLWLLLGRAITGLLNASQPLAQATVTDIAPPNRKALMLGWVAVAMTVGMLAGPLVGGLLVKPWLPLGLALPFVVAATLALCNAGLLVQVFPETYQPNRLLAQTPWRHAAYTLWAPNVLPKLMAFTLLEFTWSWYFQGVAVVLAPLGHWSPSHTAWILASLGVSMSLGLCLIFPFWLKQAKVRTISVVSLISISFAWLLSLTGHALLWHVLTAGLITVAVGIAYTALLTELSDTLGRHQQGWLMGIAASLLALAWTLSGFGLGFVSVHSTLPWLITGFGASLLTLVLWRARFGWLSQGSSAHQAAAHLGKQHR